MLKETRYKKNRRSVQEYRRIEPIKAASEGGRGKLKSQRKQLEGERGGRKERCIRDNTGWKQFQETVE